MSLGMFDTNQSAFYLILNLSDDIIKQNRSGPRNRQNKNVNNFGANQGRRRNGPPKKKFGILNQSKRIGKNNRIKRNNNSFLLKNRPNRNKSDKLAALKSRLSLNKPVGQKRFNRTKPNVIKLIMIFDKNISNEF